MRRVVRLGIGVLLLQVFWSLSCTLPSSDQSSDQSSDKPSSRPSRIDPVVVRTTCTPSLQSLVDEAAPGAVVTVPACVYREAVTINKPLTLDGQPGAEIRGSDVWSSGWQQHGGYWTRGTVPEFDHRDWSCESESNGRCQWPEQVFFDGQPLEQVAANPQSGQFAIDGDRRVILADNPQGHTVEVTTRQYWINGQSDNVTIQGFTMKHAASPAQLGALENDGHADWTIQNNVLSDTHGAVVFLNDAEELKLLDNDISRGGQQGVSGDSLTGAVVRGNHIHDNNTEAFDSGWEAGGLKITRSADLTLDQNEVDHNGGPGLWCDIDCRNVAFTNNRVHHNAKAGIMYEISHYGTITGNAAWENGWGHPSWGWGAGILVSTSDHTEVANNVVAWNADGISIVSQERSDGTPVVENYVHDNTIVVADDPSNPDATFGMGWLEDYSGMLGDPASDNRGEANAFYYPTPEGDYTRYEWPGRHASRLSVFAQTPGGKESRYLTGEEADQVLSSAGIPLIPENRQVSFTVQSWA